MADNNKHVVMSILFSPHLDMEAVEKATKSMEAVLSGMGMDLQLNIVDADGKPLSADEIKQLIQDAKDNAPPPNHDPKDIKKAEDDKESANDGRTRMEKVGDTLLKILNKDTSDLDPKSKKQVQYMELSSSIFKKIGTTGFHILQQSFGLFQDIYNYMKRSSPLLQSIDQMIQLAVQLFFMPIGNMLGELILPATLDMLEAVMAIWDGMEGMSFSEAFSYAINQGIQIAAKYLDEIGSILVDQGGLIGGVGVALQTMSGFVRQDMEKVITLFLGFARNFVEHWDEWGSIFAGAMAIHYANQASIVLAIAMGSTWAGRWGAALAISPYVVGVGAGVGVYEWINEYGGDDAAEGAYVPATSGGKLVRVAEGGEGEYIIPSSKLKTMTSGSMYPLESSDSKFTGNSSNTYNITINGMTDSELKRYIKDIIDDQVSGARLRGGI